MKSLKITSRREVASMLEAVSKATNVQWTQETDGTFLVSGSLADIQKAHHCLGEILQQREGNAKPNHLVPADKKPPPFQGNQRAIHENQRKKGDTGEEDGAEGPNDEDDDQGTEKGTSREGIHDRDKTRSPLPARYEATPKLQAFLSRFYRGQLTELEHKYSIKISWDSKGSEISLSPVTPANCSKEELRAASEAFAKLYRGVQSTVTVKSVRLQEAGGNERKAIARIAKDFPVMIERSDDRTQWLIYGQEEHVMASLDELRSVCDVCRESPSDRVTPEADHGSIWPAATDAAQTQFQQLLFETVNVAVSQGDLVEERVHAIVNAANDQLAHAGGLALAISQKGGPSINRESKAFIKKNGSLQVGEVMHTGPGNLPCKFVIHAVGPQWRQECGEKIRDLLRLACLNALHEAEKLKLVSIALPAISSGIFGMPKEICAQAMFEAVEEYSAAAAQSGTSVSNVRFVNIDDATVGAFRKEFVKRYRASEGRTTPKAEPKVEADPLISRGPRRKEETGTLTQNAAAAEPANAWGGSTRDKQDFGRGETVSCYVI